MIGVEQVTEFIKRGIWKFAKVYHAPATDIRIKFSLSDQRKVVFVTCLNNEPKHTVKLRDLIGENIYNFLVEKYIRKILENLSHKHGIALNEINLMAGLGSNDVVYLCVRKNQDEIYKITDPGELMEK